MGAVRSVAVIGAGPSGLAAAKEALAAGMSPTIFEQRLSAGGTWCYSPDPSDKNGVESSAMYRSVTANASRPFLEFSDFPIPSAVPVYPRHFHMAQYFQTYAEAFRVDGRILFGCRVLSVTPDPERRWRIRWETGGLPSSESSETFDAVAIASGHHSIPRWPSDIPGRKAFGGPILHSRSYKTPSNPVETFDRRVLIVGIGNSGCDIATDIAGSARRIFLASRSGGWVFPRWIEGRPVDQVDFESRLPRLPTPEWLSSWRVKRRYFGPDAGVQRWGLRPQFGPYEAHAAVNEQLFPCIGNGSISIKGGVKELLPGGVAFADGTSAEIDLAIFATGFSIRFPFLAPELNPVDEESNRVDLYMQMLAPDLPPTLAFVGVVQPQTGFMPIVEMQARWIAALWQGRISLPSRAEMLHSIAADGRKRRSMYVDRPRHTIEVEWPGYTDRLAKQLGAMPKLLRHPRVLRSILWGPVHSAQYRLDGIGATPEAAERSLQRLGHDYRNESFNKL